MSILGWIREGDVAACGASVVEGDRRCISHGRAYAYQGAAIACQKRCVIMEGAGHALLTNGKARVLHGMRSTAGCPLVSTLNEIDGVGTTTEIFPAFVPDGVGGWRGFHPPAHQKEKKFDEYFIVIDKNTGAVARNRFYRITLDTGEIIEGQTDGQGRTGYAKSDRREAVTLELGRQREIDVGG